METTCKNVFLESDGYCTQCGRTHSNKRISVSKKGIIKKAKTLNIPAVTEVYRKAEVMVRDNEIVYFDACEWYWLQPYDAWQMRKLGTTDFSVHEYNFGDYDWHRCNIMRKGDEVYISTSLLTTLTGWKQRDMSWEYTSELKIGHKFWFFFSSRILEKTLEQSSYPARNQNEAAVRLRNLAIAQWLYRLAGGSYVSAK